MPYRTVRNALTSIDNGGRFYNLLTKANDGNISTSELGKVAGSFSDKQKMVLYLEMSLSQLDKAAKNRIYGALSGELKRAYKSHKPQCYSPAEAKDKGILASNAIITGVPKFVNKQSDFAGFIFVPIVSAGITTMMMIPLIDHYDVYEIKDRANNQEFLIAHARCSKKLPQKEMRFGGVLKELQTSRYERAKKQPYLNTNYYCLL